MPATEPRLMGIMKSGPDSSPTHVEIQQVLRVAGYLARKTLRWTSWCAAAFLMLVLTGYYLVGHRNPTIAFMLYLPPWIWAVPSAALLTPSLLFDLRPSGLASATALLLYLGPGLRFELRPERQSVQATGGATLSILTYNRGQSQGTSLQPFMNSVGPDMVALQDAGGRATQYQNASGYTAFEHVAGVGEFTLLSRFPIVDSRTITAVPGDPQKARVVAARFEIEWKRPIAVYSVHLPTHRGMLMSERGGGFMAGIVGLPGTPWAEKRRTRESYWEAALALAHDLASQIQKEKLPVIVIGDFNAPPFGPMYREFSGFLGDAHREAGSGYGFTFPGETNNPLALMRPWLRLDYVLFSPGHWRATRQITEPSRPSQHRAVFAELEFVDER